MVTSILIIQTAFLGDVVLATSLAEKLHSKFPTAKIDFLLRKGNEDLLKGHPFLTTVRVWDKKKGKIKNLIRMIRDVRAARYDLVVNAQRFASSGFITAFSGARTTIGFDKNPLSFLFTKRKKHVIVKGVHEIERNQLLIENFTEGGAARPKLYPTVVDREKIKPFLESARGTSYVCIAPTSVWFTKQYPSEKWIEFIRGLDKQWIVYLLGAPGDAVACDTIAKSSQHPRIVNLAGKLNFLESAALMETAVMNFVNDSAPMHLASSVNAPVTAIFCSTVPDFGFGPLSDVSKIVETMQPLDCRPCGLHGFKACPLGHFKCAESIYSEQLM